LLRDLAARGFVYQYTNQAGIDALFNAERPVTFYVGFDPTALNLHIGHLFWIRLVQKLKAGSHNPLVLCGGGTAKIGDTTWKDKVRSMLDYKVIQENIKSIMSTLTRLIGDVKMVDNDDWLSKLNYLEFLRDYGSMFSVNKMLTMDSVSERLRRQQHLSFLEFNYALLQAYDFLYLFESQNCKLQIGGADQWSNIISGVDIIRRVKEQEAYGLTMPLLTNANGVKMGKTVGGAVWLNASMTSPFDFWQYWRNVDDRDVCKFLKIFTDLPISEINEYESDIGTPKINEAKIKLADGVTEFVHTKEAVNSVKQTVKSLFGSCSDGTHDIPDILLPKGTSLDSVLMSAGLASSLTQARKLIEGNGVKVDDVLINSIKHKIEKECVVVVGKKNFRKIVVT
jgi:tyrosyl-tRNA synthetase